MVSTSLISSNFCYLFRQVNQVVLVPRGNEYGRDSGPCRSRQLFLNPPIGSTLPRRVSSPVMATSWRAGLRHNSDASAAAMVMPAEGPSLGTPPAGTCR